MKTDFSVKVSIDLGLTNELVDLIRRFLGDRGKLISGRFLFKDDQPTPAPGPVSSGMEENDEREEEEDDTRDNPLAESEEQESEEQESVPEQAEQKFTKADFRKAINRTRIRIEGEDYEQNTSGEKYKKYHRALTDQFLQIARALGAEKPSLLPPDKIGTFIEQCDAIIVKPDDTLGVECPF